MAGYTQHYGLHQWEPGDPFLRTDFNGDFEKIDTAIKEVEAGTDAKLVQKAEVVVGSYVGNGATATVTLGFQPKAVFVPVSNYYVAMATGGFRNSMLYLLSDGFEAIYREGEGASTNSNGGRYYYLALK